MKKYLFFAASALAVVSCSNDDYLGNNDGNGQGTNSAILFDGGTSKTTRATTGATNTYNTASLQKNGFWVYGYKTKIGSTDQVVYTNYYLNYITSSENQSLSNTKGWEYVGVNNSAYANAVIPHLTENQTIKYWDYSADSYTFFAATANPENLTSDKVKITYNVDGEKAGTYTVTLKEGADLSQLYFADKVEVEKSTNADKTQENKYGGYVKFQFRNALAKVRVAVFETIPGYSVQINKFYYTNEGTETADGTNFAADVTNTKLGLTETGVDYQVTFNTEGQAVIQPNTSGEEGVKKTYITLGNNIQAKELGEDALNATYDYENESYTWFIAQPNNDSDLKLKVDYTLTSLDGSNEQIKVTGATAIVPADYLKWKNNYAYTYIFKISENTNGGTGGDSDPKGLYPITFDAAVIETDDGIQETITSVSDPSITTYGKGTVANEYKPNTNIYVSASKYADGGAINLTDANTKLYVVTTETNMEVTEANVANCLKNGKKSKTNTEATEDDTWTVSETVDGTTKTLKLTTIDAPAMTAETSIPESDVQGGDAITGKFMKFKPTTAGTYVFEYIDNTDADNVKNYYKVIKVVE